MLIAIDGPAGAGKSTVARALAERYGLTYLDSGAMYRCVALAVVSAEADPDDADRVAAITRSISIQMGVGVIKLDGADVTAEIRRSEVTEAASRVSVHSSVREALVERQRELVEAGRWVAEGRDIGTVVCPDSPLKIFLVADEAERARRRAAESEEELTVVHAAIRERDQRDSSRAHGALKPADDAVEVDTTGLSIDQVIERIGGLARDRDLL